jgi:hypothetical protein
MNRHFHNQYRSAETLIPNEYVQPVKNESTQAFKSINIDLNTKPVLKTTTPEGYIPCPKDRNVLFFSPFIKWSKFISKEKPLNTLKDPGDGFEVMMDSLLKEAHDILLKKSKKSGKS